MQQQIADGERADREHGDRGVAVDARLLPRAEQEDGAEDRDGQDEEHVAAPQTQHGGDGGRAEGHVAQPVADEGKPLEHERDAEERRAQRDQNAHDQRIAHGGIGEILPEGHTRSPPLRRR